MVVHELSEVAFPTLSDEQLTEFEACSEAALETYADGEVLIEVGQRDFAFHVVKSGAVAVLDVSGDAPRVVTVHEAGAFTGDVSHLTGNPSVIRAVARGVTQVYTVSSALLRELLALCPSLSDIVLQAFIARRQLLRQSADFVGLRVIGSRYSRDTSRVRDFLAKNRVLFTWLDLETEKDVEHLLQQFGVTVAETPVVACAQMVMLRNPTERQLAETLGLRRQIEQRVFDLAVVGAGPAGLGAAVYGASEGLSTVLLERTAPGGQAGISMRIENYLGFPAGITGSELADRAVLQANKFGAQLSISSPVAGLAFDGRYPIVTLADGETVGARSLLIATGAEYRRLDVEDCQRFEGCGVCYAATMNEASLFQGNCVMVVGGGNSAGQAAVFLAARAKKVYLLIRGGDLGHSMSSYLVHRIEQTDNIELRPRTVVHRLLGDRHLASVEVRHLSSGEIAELPTPALFSFIGAVPRTDWLPPSIQTDTNGFVLTGAAVRGEGIVGSRRPPYLLETSQPGVFAAGDVRAGSIKRVASAVGEGAMVIKFVHEYLAEA